MLNIGQILNGRYKITKMVGAGGMSTVYQAQDLQTDMILAVKDAERSGQNNNTTVEQSLAAEGRMLKALSNPHLPRIYEIIEQAGSFLIVMDFIYGESLDKIVAKTGPQPVDKVLDWGMQICQVLHYLHSQPVPIIYRDMKPANIMLQPNGEIMLIDFGTARTEKVGVTMAADTVCIGTEGFAAPEQYGGIGQSTARTDIFCLGATLYNLVTGHCPHDPPRGILPLDYFVPHLAGSPLEDIIKKCTKNDPDMRYQNAMELYKDLQLVRTGAYRGTASKPKSGTLRKGEWQKTDLRGKEIVSGGLSSILQRGKQEAKKGPPTAETVQHTGDAAGQPTTWNTDRQIGLLDFTETEMPQTEQSELSKKLTLIAVLIAAIFVVLAMVLMGFGENSAAVIFMGIALVSAVGSVIGAVLTMRNGKN